MSTFLVFNHIDTSSVVVALTKSAPPEYTEVIKEQPLQQGAVPVQQGIVPVKQGVVLVKQVIVPVKQGAIPVQYVQQPGQPQCIYTQHPGVQPGVHTTPCMVIASLNLHCVLKVSIHLQNSSSNSRSTLNVIPNPGSTQVQTPFQPTTFPQPKYPGPHDFCVFVVITTAILATLSPTSLAFGVPSSILSILVSSYTRICIHKKNLVVFICSTCSKASVFIWVPYLLAAIHAILAPSLSKNFIYEKKNDAFPNSGTMY